MNTLNFLDSNVWLALIWSRHVHSERARSWFAAAAEQQFFFCRFTQLTVLRLLTTESVMAKETRTMSEAWALWDRVWADCDLSRRCSHRRRAADGWSVTETTMRTVEVVVLEPGRELLISFF